MAATTHNNYQKLPAGPVDWVAIFNDLCDKLERGHTVKLTAAVALVEADPFYIDSNGKAAKATDSTAYAGLWQSASTAQDAIGYGQISGLFIKTGWDWTPGGLVYVNSSSALTQTPTSKMIGVALSETEIIMFPPGSIPGVQLLTSAAEVTVDWSKGKTAKITLGHDVAFTFTGAIDGDKLVLRLTQDGTGGRDPSWPGTVRYGTDITEIEIDPAIGKQTYIGFLYDADATKYDVVSVMKGF